MNIKMLQSFIGKTGAQSLLTSTYSFLLVQSRRGVSTAPPKLMVFHSYFTFKFGVFGRNLLRVTLEKLGEETRYKLKYFGFRAIGEPIRWQFIVAGVPFTDERIPRESWDTLGKQHLGFGRLPILEINDGEIEITQSCAISRFLAAEFGQLPETNLLRIRADELVDNLQDLRLCWRPWVREFDPAKKAVLEAEMRQIHFPFYIPRLEKFVSQHGANGFAIGDKLCWADFYLACLMQVWTENHGLQILDEAPTLKAHMNKIVNIPAINSWIEKRPISQT